jgi:hypothetical protein
MILKMILEEAIKKTLFKYKWIRDHLKRNRTGHDEIKMFSNKYIRYLNYHDECPLCELYSAGSPLSPDCPECILNSDNCFNEYGRFQKFMREISIPKKRKFCDWVIKQCEKALEKKN